MAAKTTNTATKKGKQRRDWKTPFLAALALNGSVKSACLAAKVDRSYVYQARQKDEAFAAGWDSAVEEMVDDMEAEARRRAVEGSDVLLIFLLKANRPAKYREAKSDTIVNVEVAAATPDVAKAALEAGAAAAKLKLRSE